MEFNFFVNLDNPSAHLGFVEKSVKLFKLQTDTVDDLSD